MSIEDPHWTFDIIHHPGSIAPTFRTPSAGTFPFFYCYEYEGYEDNSTGQYAFYTCLTDHLTSENTEQATAIGDDVALLLLGAIRVFKQINASLRVTDIAFDDTRHLRREYPSTNNLSQNVFNRYFKPDTGIEDDLKGSPLHLVFYKSLQSAGNPAETILRYFGRYLDWATLYTICETIKHHSDAGWLRPFERDKKRLGRVANNFSLAGIDARHGDNGTTAPVSSDDMTLEEGRVFCQTLAFSFFSNIYHWKNQ